MTDGDAPGKLVAGGAVGTCGEQQSLDDPAEVVEGFQEGVGSSARSLRPVACSRAR
jgi:hypothetical protein